MIVSDNLVVKEIFHPPWKIKFLALFKTRSTPGKQNHWRKTWKVRVANPYYPLIDNRKGGKVTAWKP